MKNNKGALEMSSLILVAIAVIIGTTIFTGVIAPNVGTMTNTAVLVNGTYTMPAKGSTIDLQGQELISTPVVTNRTDGVTIPAGNYTISEGVSTVDGLKSIRLTSNDPYFAGKVINVSYTYGADGYVDDSGARAVANIIPIMAALAILGAALGGVYLKDLFD